MPSRTLTGLGLRAFYDIGEDGWGVAMSEDLRKLSFLTQIAVDSIAASLPGSPADGASVLLTATAEAGNIALYDVATWIYFEPNEGWRLFDKATNNVHTYDGAAWVLEAGLPALGAAGRVLAVNAAGDGTEWVAPASGGGGDVAVDDSSVEVIAATSRLNFLGAGVTVVEGATGTASITIPGAAAAPASGSNSGLVIRPRPLDWLPTVPAIYGSTGLSSGRALTANTLRISPWVCSWDMTFDQFAAGMSAAVSTAAWNVVIYDTDVNNLPGDLIFDGADRFFSNSGLHNDFKQPYTPAVPFTFTAGQVLWLGIRNKDSLSRNFLAIAGESLPFWNQDTPDAPHNTFFSLNLAIADPLDPNPATWTYAPSQRSTEKGWLMMFRREA